MPRKPPDDEDRFVLFDQPAEPPGPNEWNPNCLYVDDPIKENEDGTALNLLADQYQREGVPPTVFSNELEDGTEEIDEDDAVLWFKRMGRELGQPLPTLSEVMSWIDARMRSGTPGNPVIW
jgi:hypothetical protein